MTDVEDRLRLTLQQVAQTTAVPPQPVLNTTERLRRTTGRRTAVLLAALIVPTAGAIAAAGGYLPGSLQQTFSFSDDHGLGDSTLQRVGAVPGPAGERLELWTRSGESGVTCFLSALVPDDQPADEPARQVLSSGGLCEDTNRARSRRFGQQGGGGDRTFLYNAGRATRAEVLLTDGTRLPTVLAAGEVAGWVPTDSRNDALLVGYDATGDTVGTVDLSPWNPPPAGLVVDTGPGPR